MDHLRDTGLLEISITGADPQLIQQWVNAVAAQYVQRNLERMSATRAELDEQIRITLYHELGHYLGFEEEDMDDLGLA